MANLSRHTEHDSPASESQPTFADADTVIHRLKTSPDGLSPEEARQRLEEYGPNRLPAQKAPSLFQVVFNQFRSPLIYLLLVAGVISILIGETTDAGFIFAVVFFNAAIGAFQEWKAEQSAANLRGLIETQAYVKRGGEKRSVPIEEIVPGDWVYLDGGFRVPADLRLVQADNLAIDEAILTGESETANKQTTPLEPDSDITPGDMHNMAFAGTLVARGSGWGVVVYTGLQTEIGKIAEEIAKGKTTETPLIQRMEQFTHQVSWVILAGCVLVGIVGILRDMPFHEIFFTIIALAVAAIPEGLPVVMSITLSIAMQRMVKRNVIVRKMSAVEGLGSCTYIASDKTGTLTVNVQTARIISIPKGLQYEITGEGYAGEGEIRRIKEDHGNSQDAFSETEHQHIQRLVKASLLANEGVLRKDPQGNWCHEGDPMDVALLAMAYKTGINPDSARQEIQVLKEIPYEPELRYAALFYQEGDATEVQVAVKGAVEKLIGFCDLADPDAVHREMEALSHQGYRVLAIATGTIPNNNPETLKEADLQHLWLLGLVGFMDPLRPEAKEAVKKCLDAGVRVAMITGDHPATAATIAAQLNIIPDRSYLVVTGSQLNALGTPDNPAFQQAVQSTSVFARISPLQKVQIVETLQQAGHFVAVTGDGVNDAPALRKAHISVAMGSGSDIAKDIGAIILADDNFASLVVGMEEGRFAYENLRKVIYFLIASAIAEFALVALAIFAGLPLPLIAVQILWLNLVSNPAQSVGLAFEPGEADTLNKPPRDPKEGIFDRQMIEQTALSAMLISVIGVGAWMWFYFKGLNPVEDRNLILLLMVLMENFHVLNCRSETQSVFQMSWRSNICLILGVIGVQALHIGVMHWPLMQGVLQVQPVSWETWLVLLALASCVLWGMELYKLWRRRHPRPRAAILVGAAHEPQAVL